jgi:hypothetical protein
MRRSSLLLILVAALAGCSSGTVNVAGGSGSDATKFCAAVATVQSAKGSPNVAATGAAFSSAAADIQTYAPAEIKDASGIYATMVDTVGKAAKAGTMDASTLQRELAKGMSDNAGDIAKVAIWVSKNCPRK